MPKKYKYTRLENQKAAWNCQIKAKAVCSTLIALALKV
jgi:hypothetical protein